MIAQTQHLPVVVILDSHGKHTREIDLWLEQSRYSTCEAGDVFKALEELSDFTVRQPPDVVYLHVERVETERQILEDMLPAAFDVRCPSVIAMSESTPRPGESCESMLALLETRLDNLIAEGRHAS